MTVEAQLGIVGEVRTELDEAGAEVVVDEVDVAGIDNRRAGDQFGRRLAGDGIHTTLRAQHTGLLLGLANVENILATGPATKVLLRHVVLALTFSEADKVHTLMLGKALQTCHEPPGHRRHQDRWERDCPALRERTRPSLRPSAASVRRRRDTACRGVQDPASHDSRGRHRQIALLSSSGLRTMGSPHGYHKPTWPSGCIRRVTPRSETAGGVLLHTNKPNFVGLRRSLAS